MECRIAVEGKIEKIEDRGQVNYQPGDDGIIEPLPPTATEVQENLSESEFSDYVGLRRSK